MEVYDPATYDPYADPDIVDTLTTASKARVDEWLVHERDCKHMMQDLHKYPSFMVNMWAKNYQEKQNPYLTPEERLAFSNYWSVML